MDTREDTNVVKLLASTYTYLWRSDVDAAFDELAAAGFAGVELLAAPPHVNIADPAATVESIARASRNSGLVVHSVVPSGLDVNLASPDPTMREWSVAHFVALGEIAAALGARRLLAHPGRRHPLRPPAVADCAAWAVDGLSRIAETLGGGGPRLLMENTPTGLLDTAVDCVTTVRSVGPELLGICYDVANAHVVEDVVTGLRVAGEHLGLVHLSDCRQDAWAHDPIGAGDIRFDRVRNTLAELGYDDEVVVETLHDGSAKEGFAADRAALRTQGW